MMRHLLNALTSILQPNYKASCFAPSPRKGFAYNKKPSVSSGRRLFRYDNSVKTPNLFVVNLDHMLDQVENLVAVAPLVVVPRNQLEEVGVQPIPAVAS